MKHQILVEKENGNGLNNVLLAFLVSQPLQFFAGMFCWFEILETFEKGLLRLNKLKGDKELENLNESTAIVLINKF